jgi:RNA polymerase sigma-70 factor (ECF subfamily)
LTDAELLRGVRAGDLSAWEQIYVRCLPTVWRYVYLRAGGDRHLAEDVVGETVLALVRQVSSLTSRDGNLSGWLITVARNKLADHRRNAARAAALPAKARDDKTLPVVSDGPEAAVEAAETRKRVLTVMDGLPDEERLALEWKYIDGLSVGDIADRLGRTEKAVESVLYRARRSFRAHFHRLFGTGP